MKTRKIGQIKPIISDPIRKYHIPGMPTHCKRAKNAIYLNAGSRANHEIGKAVAAYQLIKFGEVRFTSEIINALKLLEGEITRAMKGFPKQKSDFITEAVPNQETDRRVDLVDVTRGDRYELENDHSIKKENAITIYI